MLPKNRIYTSKQIHEFPSTPTPRSDVPKIFVTKIDELCRGPLARPDPSVTPRNPQTNDLAKCQKKKLLFPSNPDMPANKTAFKD
jgi:hypothetical protein